jgi:hypothetical protein
MQARKQLSKDLPIKQVLINHKAAVDYWHVVYLVFNGLCRRDHFSHA